MTAPPDEVYLRRAIELARAGMEADEGGPFGAVVVVDSEVVGEGFNRVLGTNDPTAHAEIVAIRDAARRLGRFSLAGGTLYTSCEPCPMCLAAALWARLDRIVYAAAREDAAHGGFDDSDFYLQVCLPPAERAVRMERALGEEGAALFDDWNAKPDRTPY